MNIFQKSISVLLAGITVFGVFLFFFVLQTQTASAKVGLGKECERESWNGSTWVSQSKEECDQGTCAAVECHAASKVLIYRCEWAASTSQDDCSKKFGAVSGPTGGYSPDSEGPPASDGGDATQPNQTTVQANRSDVVSLESPINCGGSVCSIPYIIARIINFVLTVVGAIAVLMLIYAGVMYMTSAGNEKRMTAAKATITYTILGLVVVFLSMLIVSFTIRILGVE